MKRIRKPPVTNNKRIIVSIVVLLLLFDVFVSGYLKFAYNVVKCGAIPVALDNNRFAARTPTYTRPNYYTPWAAAEYVCTVKEAIRTGHIESFDSKFEK